MNNSPVKSELYVALEMVELTQFLPFTLKAIWYDDKLEFTASLMIFCVSSGVNCW
jgi:hypothetical protein